MQSSTNIIAANHSPQVRPTSESTEFRASGSYSTSPSHNASAQTAPPKRSAAEGEHHQRTHSSAMGPMGANENHGPVRSKPTQQSAPQNPDGPGPILARKSDSHQDRGMRGGSQNETDHDQDEEMEENEDADRYDSEENIDELMDEAELEEAEESSFYSRPDSHQQRGYQDQPYSQQQQQQQASGHGSRSLPNILPRPGSGKDQAEGGSDYLYDGASHERDHPDEQRHSSMSVWDANAPRQGAPRNNRPLQARPALGAEMGGASDPNYEDNNSNGTSPSNGASSANAPSAAFHSVIVNNGSSKKRTTPAKHKCPQCDKYFTRPFNLKSHQRTHTQERPFVCSFAHCARAFSRLHDCNRHMRTHWRIKPYSCPECHRNFVRQDALTRHLRLDFGHNRCSGYPGPLPGGSSNQDKTDESADDAMGDSSTDTPGHSYSGPTRMDGGSAAAKAGPSYATTTSPTSPSLPSPGGHVHRAPRPDNQDIDTHRPVAPVMPARDSRMPPKSTLGPETVQAGPEPVEEREPVPRRDAAPHTRYPSASAPISFVHRSAPVERRAVTPPQAKDNPAFLSQHSRSYSHSSFTHAQATASASAMSGTPPTSQSSGPPLSNGMSSLERRNPPTNTRNGGPWPAQGHEAGASAGYYDQNPPSSRPPPSGPGISRHEGPYGPEYDRQRTVTVALPPEYPSSPHDTKHHSPPAHSSEWAAQEGTRSWSWEHRASEARHRQSTWSSSSSIKGPAPPQLPQEQVAHPSSMPPPLRASTMDSWQKGPSREDVISRDAREGPSSGRMPPRSSSSYSNTPYAEEPASDNHPRPLPGPTQPMARPTEPFRRPEQERDPRQRSMTEIDRIRGPGAAWSEQRSRSYHELDTNVDPRSRYEQHPNSPQHGWDGAPVGRASAVDGPPPAPERSHSYSGVVGVERMHPQGARYHDRNVSRDAVVNSNDAIARDYRPTRPHSTMEYESDRDAYHRQQRYSGEPKPLPREQRRSMSPVPPHRHVGVDPGRPYEGNPRYSYPTDRSEQYSREETVKMSSRSFRHEERLVMSPISREDQGGYFGEPGRPNSFRASQNYPSAPPRLQDPSHRQSDVQRELPRRDRHSVDMPLASPTSAAGAASKRPMSTASVASR